MTSNTCAHARISLYPLKETETDGQKETGTEQSQRASPLLAVNSAKDNYIIIDLWGEKKNR